MTLTICCALLYVFDLTGLSKHCRPRWDAANAASNLGLHCLLRNPAILDTTLGVSSTCSYFRLSMVRSWGCLNTKGKYGKVRDTEMKWSIISKSVTIIIFVEFIDQLIDYLINCASLIRFRLGSCVERRRGLNIRRPCACRKASCNQRNDKWFSAP